MLVTGPSEQSTHELVAALCAAAPAGRTIAVVHAGPGIADPSRPVVSCTLPTAAEDQERAISTTMLMEYDHVVVLPQTATAAALAIVAMNAASVSVVLGIRARDLERAIEILVAEVAIALRVPHETAAVIVTQNVELGVELREVEGRSRVVRVSDLEGGARGEPPTLRDLWVLGTSADGKGVFKETKAGSRTDRRRGASS
jgi:hypothetical protein